MTEQDIGAWLATLGLETYADVFQAHDIDLDVLPELELAELRELGVSLGHAKRILRAVRDGPPAPTPTEKDAERRQLTVAFCDLVGSTGLSETLDPEDLREVLDGYYRRCGELARRFGGEIARVTGDGVDLYFGYPHAFERSALAAVEAALEIVEAVAEMSAGRAPEVPELTVRIGVHTGLAVVGAVGGSGSDEGIAVGDVPVIAARIQTAAEPGTVVVSEATAQLVGLDLGLDDLGPCELKGLSAPLRLFAVAGREVPSEGSARAEASQGSGIVGREAELASLHARWELACDGNGQVVVLTGEAGIGKSRMAQALASSVAGAPPVLRFQCSPYRSGTALWPVVEHLSRAAGIRQGDPSDARLERLERLIAMDAGRTLPEDAVPVLAALLSIDYEQRFPRLALEPEQLRERTLAVIAEYLGVPDRELPALVVFEDVHWADPTSLELIGAVVERCADSRILIVITCRPDHPVSWLEHAHVATLHLGKLADRHVRAIVDRVTHGKSLPDAVVERILVQTDGVPLFVEELTRAVLESGVLVDEGDRYGLSGPLPDTAIPATLRDSLATRLDRLGRVKEVAQVASVIGREFTFDLLADVSGMERPALTAALELLGNSGLVLRRDAHSSDWFVFKHALVQNAAYDGMLRSKRRALHERVADLLERRPRIRDEQPELVAHHLDQAGLADRAINMYVRAGERASAGSHHEEAVGQYRRALELLATLPASRERTERELDVHASFRNALVVLRGYSSPEVAEACAVALALCEERGGSDHSFPVLWNLAGFHMVRGDHAACGEINARLLEIAETTRSAELQLMADDTVGQTLFYQARFEEALTHFTRVRDLYDAETHRHLARTYAEEDPGAAALGYGSVALWAVGRRTEARTWVDQAVDLAESLPYFSTRGLVMSIVVHLAYCRSDFESARAAAATMSELAEEHGLGYYIPSARVQQGWVLAVDGETDAGIALMREGIAGFERVGALLEQPFTALLLADGLLRGGRPAEAVAVLDEKLALVQRTGERCFETELFRMRGEARAADGGPPEDAERDLHAALQLAVERNAPSFRLRAASSLLRFHLGHDLPCDPAFVAEALAALSEGLDEQDVREARTLLARR